MNTTTHSPAAGLHRGIWIGGGLMALTIIALATTLVARNNGAAPAAPAAPLAAVDTGTTTAPATTLSAPPAAATPPVAAPMHPARHAWAPEHLATAREAPSPPGAATAPACATCGVVDGYSAVKVQGHNNGVGAVAGGVGGALIGSKIAGRNNHTIGGVVGAIGGGLLGNAIETHERTTTAYDVRVRMADGSVRTVRQAAVPTVGQRVNVEGGALHPTDDRG